MARGRKAKKEKGSEEATEFTLNESQTSARRHSAGQTRKDGPVKCIFTLVAGIAIFMLMHFITRTALPLMTKGQLSGNKVRHVAAISRELSPKEVKNQELRDKLRAEILEEREHQAGNVKHHAVPEL